MNKRILPPNLRSKTPGGPKINMPAREQPPDVRYVPSKDLFELLRKKFRDANFEQAAISASGGSPYVLAALDEFEAFCRRYLAENQVRSTGFSNGLFTVFLTDGNQVPIADVGEVAESVESPSFQIHQPLPDKKMGMQSLMVDNTSVGITGNY